MYNIVLLDELARLTKFLVSRAKQDKAWSKEALYDLDVEKIKEAQPFKKLMGVQQNGKDVNRQQSRVLYRTHR